MDTWKAFRRKSCDAAALVLKIDTDNEQVVLDGGVQQMSPEVRTDMHLGNELWPQFVSAHTRGAHVESVAGRICRMK